MSHKRCTPARARSEGAEGRVAADFDALTTSAVRVQFLMRSGLPSTQAQIIAPLAFGEVSHV
jgi:hypothetical protein